MKLTTKMLRQLVEAEMKNFGAERDVEDADATEVDADEFGTDKSLEKKIDVAKALKVEEGRLRRRLRKISEQKASLRKQILEKI